MAAWAHRHGITTRIDNHFVVCPLEGFEKPLRVAAVNDEVVVLALVLPLRDENSDLGLVGANPEERQAILYDRAMGKWKPKELYYPAAGDDPPYIKVATQLYLSEGATDTQLDEGMCDVLDALFDALAFHPSVVMAAAEASVKATGEPKPVTWKLLDHRRQHASAAPAKLTNKTEDSERIPWWDIDQEKVGKAVTAQRLVNILRWYDAEISCEKHGENDVISLRRKGLPIEVLVSPHGRISICYHRELTLEEANSPGLKEWLAENIDKYGWVQIGMRRHSAGMTLRFESWQPAMRVTEEQIDAFLNFVLEAFRSCIDRLDRALGLVVIEGKGE